MTDNVVAQIIPQVPPPADRYNYSLTEEDATALVALLMERGYFSANDNDSNASNENLDATTTAPTTKSYTSNSAILGEYPCEDTPELRERMERDNNDGSNSAAMSYVTSMQRRSMSQLIVTTDQQSYMTQTVLVTKVKDLLHNSMGGRVSISVAANLLRVTEDDITRVMDPILHTNTATTTTIASADCDHNHIIVASNHYILLPLYFDKLIPTLRHTLIQKGGAIVMSELATIHRIPLDLLYQQVLLRLESLDAILVGGTLLWTHDYEQYERARVCGACCALVAPTQLSDLLSNRDTTEYWSTTIQDMIATQQLADGCTLHSAMVVPGIYGTLVRRHIDTQFRTQGYVTVESCKAMGIGTVAEYVQRSFPNAVPLTQVIVDTERVVGPLLPILQDAITDHSFADLRLHLPEGLCHSDVITFIQDMAVPRISNESGVTVVSQGEVIFVTSSMIKFISTKLLPPLIETFAHKFAVHLDSLDHSLEHMDTMLPAKGKKSRKATASNRPRVTETVVPLHDVAAAVIDAYPNLTMVQQSYGPPIAQSNAVVPWEIDDDTNDLAGGPVFDLCRTIVYNTAFQESCRLAVDAELERLRSTKNVSSVRNRKDGAAKIRSTESSFEETFPAACHQLYLHSKVFDFVHDSDADVDSSLIRNDFLRSHAASFASRITQYCLFKNELEGDIVSFSNDASDGTSSGTPPYCQPIHRSQRRYQQPYLACIVDKDGIQQKPLPTLRKVLSGSLGVTLARLWTNCGIDSYDGGNDAKHGDDESGNSIRPGCVNDFMSFVEENCLTICGIPYSKLNKKVEKQYLFARRQELTAALEKASDPTEVLELTVMLLFQQLRGLVVAGPYLTGPFLQLLCRDKKLPESVAISLQLLAKQIRLHEEQLDEENLEKVKACGLSRDIVKHCVS